MDSTDYPEIKMVKHKNNVKSYDLNHMTISSESISIIVMLV